MPAVNQKQSLASASVGNRERTFANRASDDAWLSDLIFERAFYHGKRSGESHDLCPCLASLIADCDFEPYEAMKFADGFQAAKRELGLPIDFECDHGSPLACLATAGGLQPIRE
jgi:hypothetical protein